MQIDNTHRARICAVLGPTNTGKTYLALERMMGQASGMIGFPLRLLARENYDRVVQQKGPEQVALITGEEKIIPPHARYFMCTVESMPVERDVDFLAIDEIQLCADPDRGHIFTDRLLNARGRYETMFMGSSSMLPLIRHLVPDVEFEERPRFSNLTYSGSKKITRLPSRSAIVAFSASEVYAIAELIRRQKGGAAVVLGALSPRTRNAQVELYQEGEVDFIVATDAIGMGLNMDVDHVAFAALSKFDGHRMRQLYPPEMAQIAGRAGRYMTDGTFGVSADCPPIDPEIVERLEAHEFETLDQIYWRNSRLRFTSLDTLQMDLKRSPQTSGLLKPRQPEDEITLDFLCKNPDVVAKANSPKAVQLLWDVCQTPDFSKTMSDSHPRLLGQMFLHLRSHNNKLPTDWVAGHVKRLDRVDGDIDTLTQRLAGIRTWTYVSQRGAWLNDPSHWQTVTRQIEDKISDALHQQLTKRFVDRRTSVLMKKLKDREDLLAAVNQDGDVLVEGHYIGHMEGFTFVPDETDSAFAKRAVHSASLKALRQEVERRVIEVEGADDKVFSLTDRGRVMWSGHPCGQLFKGNDILSPRLEILNFDLVDGPLSVRLKARLQQWLARYLQKHVSPLLRLDHEGLKGSARGIGFQLIEALGILPKTKVSDMLNTMQPHERKALRKCGVEIGRHYVYAPRLLKAASVRLRGQLWCLYHDHNAMAGLAGDGLMSMGRDKNLPDTFYRALGYDVFGDKCLRIDMVERLAELAWERTRKGPGPVNGDFTSLGGCSVDDMGTILQKIGYHIEKQERQVLVKRKKSQFKKKTKKRNPRKMVKVHPDSPFAQLKNWNR